MAVTTINIDKFTDCLWNITDKKKVVAQDNRDYFGKITLCFQNGVMSHIEKLETVKK